MRNNTPFENPTRNNFNTINSSQNISQFNSIENTNNSQFLYLNVSHLTQQINPNQSQNLTQFDHIQNLNYTQINPPRTKKCQCGSTTHLRITHTNCPLNKNKRKNSSNVNLEIREFVQTLDIQNPQFVTNQSQMTQNERDSFIQKIFSQNNNNFYTQNQNSNYIGAQMDNIQFCSNQLQISTIFNQNLNQNPPFNRTRSSQRDPGHNSNLQITNSRQNIQKDSTFEQHVPIYRNNPCRCGSYDHQRTNSRYCPLNSRFLSSQTNIQNVSQMPLNQNRSTCRCGSTTHSRITHSECRLNKNRPSNSQSNQMEDLIDLADFFDASTEIQDTNVLIDSGE